MLYVVILYFIFVAASHDIIGCVYNRLNFISPVVGMEKQSGFFIASLLPLFEISGVACIPFSLLLSTIRLSSDSGNLEKSEYHEI